jgi:tetratricopeptide (TPR) repeat protein
MPSIKQLIELGVNNLASDEASLREVNKFLDQALSIDPNCIEALYYKGVANRFAGETEKVLAYAEKIFRIEPNSLFVFNLKAAAYIDLKEDNKAKEFYKKIIETADKLDCDSTFYSILGNAYNCLGEPENAKKYYLKALELNELNPFSLCNLARIKMDEKDYNGAISLFEKTVQVWKNQPVCFNDLAVCYKEIGEYKKAIEYYKAELSLSGEDGFVDYDDLAECYSNLEDYDNAVIYFDIFFKKYPTDVWGLLKAAQMALDMAEKDKENQDFATKEENEGYALELLDLAHKYYQSKDFDRKALSSDQKKEIKHAFAVREELRSIHEEIKSTKIAYKQEVSYSIKHNKAWEEEEYKLAQIKNNPKLQNYYDSFKQFADSYVMSAFVENAGRVQGKSNALTDVVDLVKDSVTIIPCASLIIGAVNKAIDIAYGVNQDNQAKNILLNLKHFEEAQKLIKHIAIEVTLNKRFQIQNIEHQKGKFLSAMLKIKDKAMVNLTKEPEKALAYKDASIMITLCQKGIVNSEGYSDIEDSIINTIMDYEIKMEHTPLIKKAMKAVDDKTSCTVMAVPEIHYDNWALNVPNLLTDAYKAGGMDLVNTFIALGAYNSIPALGLDTAFGE